MTGKPRKKISAAKTPAEKDNLTAPVRIRDSHCSTCGAPYAQVDAWPRKCSTCNDEKYKNPKPVAVGIVPVIDRGLLVVRRAIPPIGKLALPGGFIETNEDVITGAVREIFQETGIQLGRDGAKLIHSENVPGDHLLLFVEFPAISADLMAGFTENDETQEIATVTIEEAGSLCFSSHADQAAAYFERNKPGARLAMLANEVSALQPVTECRTCKGIGSYHSIFDKPGETSRCIRCKGGGKERGKLPILVADVELAKVGDMFKHVGDLSLVSIRPVAREGEKEDTYLGILLGDLPMGVSASLDGMKLKIGYGMPNPAIYVPALKRIVLGIESWWRPITSADELEAISDEDIDNTPVMQALKASYSAKADKPAKKTAAKTTKKPRTKADVKE